MAESVAWGPSMPYLICGARNEHPGKAMSWEGAGKRLDGTGFYDLMKAEDKHQSWKHVKPSYEDSAAGRPPPRR